MPRFCAECGRPRDAEHHDVRQMPDVGLTLVAQQNDPEADVVLMDVPHGFPNRWRCRTTLIAESPTTGKLYPIQHPQRITELNNRHVLTERLEPGGDLHEQYEA